jgi:predicted DNA-binding protein (UPF0251 family)
MSPQVHLDLLSIDQSDQLSSTTLTPFDSGLQTVAGSKLTLRQVEVINAMIANPDASQSEIAEIVGVTRMTVWRYFQNKDFQAEYKFQVGLLLKASRTKVAAALIAGATNFGGGMASLQRLYWQLVGDLKEQLELTGAEGGPIQLSTIDISQMSPEARRILLDEVKRIGSSTTIEAQKVED